MTDCDTPTKIMKTVPEHFFQSIQEQRKVTE